VRARARERKWWAFERSARFGFAVVRPSAFEVLTGIEP